MTRMTPIIYGEQPKARLVTGTEILKDKLRLPFETPMTAYNAMIHGDARDHRLARLDDMSRKAGTVSIATLSSLGTSHLGGRIPLGLGALAWMTAMAIPYHVMNALVWLKTGVNLGAQYRNSNLEIKRVFLDPNYMPLHVLPVKQRKQLALRLGIEPNHPDSAELLEARIKQIVVQTHTWWMLVAGLSTPILAATICDRLEDPLKKWISRQWLSWTDRYRLQPALKSQRPSRIRQAIQKRIDMAIGGGHDMTPLSRWWKGLPQDLMQGLAFHEIPAKNLGKMTTGELERRISQHVMQRLRDRTTDVGMKNRVRLMDTLRRQEKALENILDPLKKLLENPALSAGEKARLQQRLLFEEIAARATLRHYRTLLEMPLHQIPRAAAEAGVLHQMRHARLASVVDQMAYGEVRQAMALVGGPKELESLYKAFLASKFEQSFRQMGVSPMEFLTQAVQSNLSRRRWLRYYPGLLGIGIGVATLVYVALFLGRDFGHRRTSGQRRPS